MKVKDKIYIVLVMIGAWLVINLFTASITAACDGDIMGETEFFNMFLTLSISELVIFTIIAVVVFAIISFVKMIRKGMKEEEGRYGKKKNK